MVQAGDLSGGYPMQISYTANGNLWTRMGTSGTAWGGWSKLWSQGNDGSGSGLDADTLDGVDSTNFMQAASGTTNYVPKFTGANSIGDSVLYSGATGIGIRTTNPLGDIDIRSFADTGYGRLSFYSFDGGA